MGKHFFYAVSQFTMCLKFQLANTSDAERWQTLDTIVKLEAANKDENFFTKL
ncbi:hypothetical protein ACYULU_05830 [Breznakiellaceae bacterium SP9]